MRIKSWPSTTSRHKHDKPPCSSAIGNAISQSQLHWFGDEVSISISFSNLTALLVSISKSPSINPTTTSFPLQIPPTCTSSICLTHLFPARPTKTRCRSGSSLRLRETHSVSERGQLSKHAQPGPSAFATPASGLRPPRHLPILTLELFTQIPRYMG
jgi:hypothetical protein